MVYIESEINKIFLNYKDKLLKEEDYLSKILFGDDNQVNYENVLGLGIQKKFMKNNLVFKTNLKKIK